MGANTRRFWNIDFSSSRYLVGSFSFAFVKIYFLTVFSLLSMCVADAWLSSRRLLPLFSDTCPLLLLHFILATNTTKCFSSALHRRRVLDVLRKLNFEFPYVTLYRFCASTVILDPWKFVHLIILVANEIKWRLPPRDVACLSVQLVINAKTKKFIISKDSMSSTSPLPFMMR